MWAPGRTGLYRLRTAADRLLYVGIGEIPEVRWKAHSKRDWWPQVDPSRTTVDWFDTRTEAAAAEIAVIRTEQPLHNKRHMPRPPRVRAQCGYKRPDDWLKTFRLPDDDWRLFEQAAALDSDRSKELVNFVRWFNRDPRGKMPKRPPVRRAE